MGFVGRIIIIITIKTYFNTVANQLQKIIYKIDQDCRCFSLGRVLTDNIRYSHPPSPNNPKNIRKIYTKFIIITPTPPRYDDIKFNQ